jgi:hypothetical protein
MNYGQGYIEAFLHSVFNGTITEQELPDTLYYAIADYLKKGLYEGYGISFSDLAQQIIRRQRCFFFR